MLLHTFTNILVKKLFGNNLVGRFVKYLIKSPYYGPRAGNLTPGNTNNDSLCAPGHYKVVKNMAHNATRAVGMHTVSVSNCRVPDDLLHAIAELNNDENVQFVGFSRKSKPFVIAYKPEQLTDMKRFCSTATPPYLRTVLGVDRTFNLGPCFVTCIVGLYKNMSVKRVSTQAFLGPILLHFDALTESETYRCLFSNVADVCTKVLASDMVFRIRR